MYLLVTSEVSNCKVYFVIESIKDPFSLLVRHGILIYQHFLSSFDVGWESSSCLAVSK